MIEKAVKWLPQPEIEFPCADISYEWNSSASGEFMATMHFSRMVVGHDNDLQIAFGSPLAVKWEDESFSCTGVPAQLPECSRGNIRFPFPTLVIENSNWATSYADNKYAADDPERTGVVHYLMVSLNDTLHVLSESKPKSSWVSPADVG